MSLEFREKNGAKAIVFSSSSFKHDGLVNLVLYQMRTNDSRSIVINGAGDKTNIIAPSNSLNERRSPKRDRKLANKVARRIRRSKAFGIVVVEPQLLNSPSQNALQIHDGEQREVEQ